MRAAKLIALLAAAIPLAAAHAEADKKVERTWKTKCASCHGADGKGQTDQGTKMGIGDYTSAAWQKGKSDGEIKSAIENGVNREKGGKKQEMDGYKDKLTPDQIDGLVQFVRSLKT